MMIADSALVSDPLAHAILGALNRPPDDGTAHGGGTRADDE